MKELTICRKSLVAAAMKSKYRNNAQVSVKTEPIGKSGAEMRDNFQRINIEVQR